MKTENHSITGNLPDGISRWDSNLQLTYANAAFEQLAGQPFNALQGKNCHEVQLPGDLSAAFAQSLQDALNTGQPVENDASFSSVPGEHRFMYFRVVPKKNGEGKVESLLSIATDISAIRKALLEKETQPARLKEDTQAGDEPRQSEQRFRILADSIPQVIWTNNAEGKADYFNQRWYDFTGLSYQQSAGAGWQAIVHPDDEPASVEKWKKALAQGVIFDTEYRLRRHDGSYCWFIGRNVPLKDNEGNVIGWFGSATDIEDLKKAQEALSQSEERLRITMESATDYAIITMDTQRRVEKWSSGASKIFGYTEEEMIGRSADIIFTEEDRAANAPQHEMEMARNTGRAADERWHKRKDGTVFYVSGVMRPIYNQELSGYVKVARDMTQQKLFTEELHRLVAERTAELPRSNEDLRQFAHVASHDLKEPVRKIQTFNNRILDEYTEALPPKVVTYSQKIGAAARRMISMIEGVLRYSKLGNTEQVWETVDLNEVIQHITADLEVLIQQKQAIIEAGRLPTVKAHPTLMYQLFYNLILNSLKFSKKDEPPHIRISCEMKEELARITVADNGIGFEPEFNQEIFKTFTRLHPVEDYEGTGLGLALCKKIAERHGGDVYASGEAGKGAEFTVLLPLHQSQQ